MLGFCLLHIRSLNFRVLTVYRDRYHFVNEVVLLCVMKATQNDLTFSLLSSFSPSSKINHSGCKCKSAVCIQKHVRALSCYYLSTWQPTPGNVIIDGCDTLTSTGGKWLRTSSAAGWSEIPAPVAVDTLLLSEEEKKPVAVSKGKGKEKLYELVHSLLIWKEGKQVIV